ncbi:glycoside hydrolase family 5 protein [Annulohypoxylon truncatum]|uniref:glycoside hydrolase family 5 protein n=1 Tax=Annulohypoxylon truncatum TaxID=327061 RepID=UPI002008437C|nr:glycoside hydrolase family 5 protein [Annulohypoxylon truncatum]KAI1211252.1 glycoside hydrolase family 5 protein [Annulohypoxylon truncatum]
MAREDSETDNRRRRDSQTRHKHHKKKRSREHGSARPTSGSEGTSQGTAQRLSMNALAQLNEYNTRGIKQEPSREKERKPKRDRSRKPEYKAVDAEYDPPRRSRRASQSEGERNAPRKERRRKEGYRDGDGGYESRGYESRGYESNDREERRRRRRQRVVETEDEEDIPNEKGKKHRKKDRRVVSGAIVEEGRAIPAIRGGATSKHSSYDSYDSIAKEKASTGFEFKQYWGNRKKKRWIIAGVALVVLIIIIVVAVVVSKKNSSNNSDADKSNLSGVSEDSIPVAARGTYLDPFTWYDTTDLNVTYTNETVGDLPIMGLFTDWDDSKAANDKVPAIEKGWGDYSKTPARGVNLGGWLSLEPFITPSLFNYDSKLGIIDEWTLCNHLGAKTAASTLEKHYATFVTEQTFQEIQAAGLDHVRIPYSYWAVQTYDDDPYVFRTSWRYLLRGIEWARKYGLRVNLDLHGLPGSQNGWNHSGRQGLVNWLNGTNGDLNSQRSLDVHDRLTKFFAQDRYKNIITFYGLANEPRMVSLSADAVISWTTQAYNLVRKNGMTANIVFGDGFMGLANWQGKLTGMDGLVLDVHQYLIFNNDQIIYTHQKKVQYACDGWTQQTEQSMNTATGFGPTMFAEWSQADTDCTQYLTNVGWGNRWTGTYDSGNASTQALTPLCPTKDSSCTCDGANADPSQYSAAYKQFLKMFAEAQMVSFEKGWGWWYWTWDTESAPQWSYKKGLAAGILPATAYDKDFNCDSDVPDFSGLSETY